MSGIAAIVHFDGAPAEISLVQKMTAAMSYRGPDGITHWQREQTALGHCMLHTTAESLDEQQPLASDDGGLVLAMDGRVDNRRQLVRSLDSCGVRPHGQSDAELVLRAFETWGAKCLDHIDGDYALIVSDQRRRMVFCARDRIGSKPFYYHWNGNTLSVASEPLALLQLPWVPEALHEGMLAEFIADTFYSRDETLWQQIMRLPAAHCMQVSRSGTRITQYWQPDSADALDGASDEEYAAHYRSLLLDSVRRCARSHSPVGFEVSGGLDSSAVYAAAEQLRQAGDLPAPAIRAYTLDFGNDTSANDLPFARAVTNHLGTGLREVPPTRADPAWFYAWARRFRDFPGYPNGAMSLELRRAVSADGCRVLLGGSGGDEWAGGINRRLYYAEELASHRWRQAASCLRADWRDAGTARAWWWLLRDGILPLLPEPIEATLRRLRCRLGRGADDNPFAALDWMSPKLRRLLQQRPGSRPGPEHPNHPRRMRQLKQHAMLDDAFIALSLELEERLAASLGLELRHPMRDPRLIQFAVATPERLRRRGSTNKWLHRRAIRQWLPTSVLERTDKADFSTVFRCNLEQLHPKSGPQAYEQIQAWVDAAGMHNLIGEYYTALGSATSSSAGKAQWILWNIFACHALMQTRQQPAQA